MNRRNFLTVSSAGLAFTGLTRNLFAAASSDLTVVHIIRIQFAPGISPELRARMLATINRFKQIHAPSQFIVGRDLAKSGTPQYDETQISFFKSEKTYYDYFYDPIHLAADRQAYDSGEKPFESISSFDTIHGGDADLPQRLSKTLSDREAQFKTNDTRPTSPPVPDRPEDQKWNHGTTIFRVVRLDLSSMTDDQKKARFAAQERFKEIKGVQQVLYGANPRRSTADPYTHAVLVALASEEAYKVYLGDPIHGQERVAGKLLPREAVLSFDVIDPNDAGLVERLRKFHADTGM
jgi:hypothetical protein